MNIEEKLIQLIEKTVSQKYDISPAEGIVMVEIPKDRKNGDYSSNIAMRLARTLKQNPQQIAKELKDELANHSDFLENIEIAGPGFINFCIRKADLAQIINTVIDANASYGHSDYGKNLKVLEEYVSANPTGPLHCGHARGAC